MTIPPPAGTPRDPGTRSGFRLRRIDLRRYVFASIWLAYLAQTVSGVRRYQTGAAAVAGYAIVGAFAACYILAMRETWLAERPRFRPAFATLWLLWFAEIPFARQDSFVMCVYLAIITLAQLPLQPAIAVIAAMTAIAGFGPALVPSWHAGIQTTWLVTVPLVTVSMWAFFAIIRSNGALATARAEVARLAAENERTRIARDLHDLLGHSLTTITIKAGLARRLAERGQPDRALAEIAAVETLSRSTLADVRAAVAGQRDIRLINELATAREVLRAAGIPAELPGSVDIVDPALSELFGWVVREGITNVVRHSRAARCVITLGPDFIEVADDGRGRPGGSGTPRPGTASPNGTTGTPGAGLTGLRERVAAVGGSLQAGRDAYGWRLRVEVPISTGPIDPPRPDGGPPSTMDA